MKVQVKPDTSIPEGYTYTRTDLETAEEFLEHAPKSVRKYAEQYVKDHPKEVYTVDDHIAVGQMLDRVSSIAGTNGHRRASINGATWADTRRYNGEE